MSREREHNERVETDLVEIGRSLHRLIELLERIARELHRLIYPPAVTALLKIGVSPMQVGTPGTATLQFVDANGAPAQPPTGDGSGLVVTFGSSDTSILTVGAATISGTTATAVVSPQAAGTADVSATVANTSGAELLDDDGTTPFVAPTSVTVTVTAAPAGQATTAVITVE